MNEQNLNKQNHLSCLNNVDLRSDRFRIKKNQPNVYAQPTVTNGVMNRFGFKYVVNQRMSKENEQPFAEKSTKKLKKQNLFPKKPTFKVGIPHHKYWSPTARDTPVSHFHGLSRALKSRKIFSKTLRHASIAEENDLNQPAACIDLNRLKQEKTVQEVLKPENLLDKLAEKDKDNMKSNTSQVDSMNSDDLKSSKNRSTILFIIIMICYFLIKYFIINY